MTDTCETCQFFNPLGDGELGECLYNPPPIVRALMPTLPKGVTLATPRMTPKDTCDEHKKIGLEVILQAYTDALTDALTGGYGIVRVDPAEVFDTKEPEE